jgi:hypothetical protein
MNLLLETRGAATTPKPLIFLVVDCAVACTMHNAFLMKGNRARLYCSAIFLGKMQDEAHSAQLFVSSFLDQGE